MHAVGTLANVLRYVTAPDGSNHIICQGVQRFRVTEFVPGQPYLVARGLHLPEPTASGSDIEARFLLLRDQSLEVLSLLPQAPQELRLAIEGVRLARGMCRWPPPTWTSPRPRSRTSWRPPTCTRGWRRSPSCWRTGWRC